MSENCAQEVPFSADVSGIEPRRNQGLLPMLINHAS